MTKRPSVGSYLDRLTGRKMPGGCDDCDAYQTVEKQSDGLYVLTVHHDPTCPHLRGRKERAS
jgi:hypothetical protein